MTDHADTIRQALQATMVGEWGRENALRALALFEAERQQAIDERQIALASLGVAAREREQAIDERDAERRERREQTIELGTVRLRCEQAVDALREISTFSPTENVKHAAGIARAALVSLGEQA